MLFYNRVFAIVRKGDILVALHYWRNIQEYLGKEWVGGDKLIHLLPGQRVKPQIIVRRQGDSLDHIYLQGKLLNSNKINWGGYCTKGEGIGCSVNLCRNHISIAVKCKSKRFNRMYLNSTYLLPWKKVYLCKVVFLSPHKYTHSAHNMLNNLSRLHS